MLATPCARFGLVLGVALVLLGPAVSSAGPDAASRPLGDAIREFNARAAGQPNGRDQPPLTEEEVVAAIRFGMLVDRENVPVNDAEAAALLEVAEMLRLPAGWEFEVLTGFRPNDEVEFEAWSVRIVFPRIGGNSDYTYAFVIRDRWLRSTRIGPEERKVIAAWDSRLSRAGSMERADIAKAGRQARRQAAEVDRLARELERAKAELERLAPEADQGTEDRPAIRQDVESAERAVDPSGRAELD